LELLVDKDSKKTNMSTIDILADKFKESIHIDNSSINLSIKNRDLSIDKTSIEAKIKNKEADYEHAYKLLNKKRYELTNEVNEEVFLSKNKTSLLETKEK
jgi:hypothetical protein